MPEARRNARLFSPWTLVVAIGNLGGIAASFAYKAPDSPRYHPGHATNIGCLYAVAVLTCVSMLYFSRLNRLEDAKCLSEEITAEGGDVFAEMGDASTLCRYTM